MEKKFIYLGFFVGSTAGSWVGSSFDHGNFFGVWGIIIGAAGGIAGIWAGYKLGNM